MQKYNNYSSICDTCTARGFHTKPEPCQRTVFKGCPKCHSHENISKETKCKGTNVMIDYTDIPAKFVQYYGTDTRIKVKFSHGEVKTGTVGMTTGWKPALLLMLRSNSTGSSYILSEKDSIIN